MFQARKKWRVAGMTVRIGVQTKQMALGVSSYTMNDPTTFVDKETGVSSILHSSGADPYHVDTDLKKFITDPDPDPGQTLIRTQIQTKKDQVQEKSSNNVFMMLSYLFSIHNHLN